METPTSTTLASNGSQDVSRQEIETLRERYGKLRDKRIQAETELKTASDSLTKLKDEALRDYGTDDLEQLKAILKERKEANEKLLREYKEHLEGVEGQLQAVEQAFAKKQDEQQQDCQTSDGDI